MLHSVQLIFTSVPAFKQQQLHFAVNWRFTTETPPDGKGVPGGATRSVPAAIFCQFNFMQ
jgi:hypothetical protein